VKLQKLLVCYTSGSVIAAACAASTNARAKASAAACPTTFDEHENVSSVVLPDVLMLTRNLPF
jgi:hypothetical protein